MHTEYAIHIDNIKTYRAEKEIPTFDVSRTGGSPLGNPEYVHWGASEDERDAAIVRYKRWLWSQMQKRPSIQLAEVARLAKASQRGEIVLLCYCYPKICHARTVATAIRWYQRKYLLAAYEGLPEEQEELNPSAVA